MRNPAAANGRANRKTVNEHEESTETVREFQATSLRRRFALGYCVAVALAPLVWGLPR
jgi:hypothetical protein